jgi:hypothetical protein
LREIIYVSVIIIAIFGFFLIFAFVLCLDISKWTVVWLLGLTVTWCLAITIVFLATKNWLMAILLAKILAIIVVLVLLSLDNLMYSAQLLRLAARWIVQSQERHYFSIFVTYIIMIFLLAIAIIMPPLWACMVYVIYSPFLSALTIK